MAKENVEGPGFTPSIAKHFGYRAASLHGKTVSLREDLEANGCDSAKVRQILERVESAVAGLQEAILAAAVGGRINPLEQLEEERTAERKKAQKKAARAKAKKAASNGDTASA